MEELRPPFDERSDVGQRAEGFQFSLGGLMRCTILLAVFFAALRLISSELIAMAMLFLVAVWLVAFAKFGIRT
jgi:hypothetical protein